MYLVVCEFLLLKPGLDIANVPEFYKLFYSSRLEVIITVYRSLAIHLPAFTTSSLPHATFLFYPTSEQSLLSHA